MAQTLKNVIDQIYKPKPGVRSAIAVSRRVAEQLPALQSVGMISITAPDRTIAQVAEFDSLLRLSFADVDFLNPDISARAKAKLKDSFTVEQAREIHAFIRNLPQQIKTVVVHCEGGFSRSCGVVLALHEIYGFEVALDDLTEANRSVLKFLKDNIKY